MLGNFQQSSLRLEVRASHQSLTQALTHPEQMQRWLAPLRLSSGLPEFLHSGLTYYSWIGPITVQHDVEAVDSHHLRLLLSRGVDGFHEWYWGDGWVQSRLEGISLLPLNLAQSTSLLRLRQFLTSFNS